MSEEMRHGDMRFASAETSFLDAPVALNFDMNLTNDDIESVAPSSAIPTTTLELKIKKGFPTYYLNPEKRLLVVMSFVDGTMDTKAYFLKPDSVLLAKYNEKYGKGSV